MTQSNELQFLNKLAIQVQSQSVKFSELIDACDDSMFVDLDNEIENNPSLTEFSDELMDIDHSIADLKQPNSTSFSRVKVTDSNTNTDETIFGAMKQVNESDWSILSFQDPLTINSTSGIDFNSFLIIQKLMNGQANTLKQNSEANLDNPGEFFESTDASSGDEPIFVRRGKSTNVIESDDDEDKMDISFESGITLVNTPSPPVSSGLISTQLYTLKCNSKTRNYVPGIPYNVKKIALKSNDAQLEPAPILGPDGKAIHLYFEVASWDPVMSELTPKSKLFHQAAIAKLEKLGMNFEEIQASGHPCQGITLQVGSFWYSLRCLYDRNINVTTAGFSARDGLQWKCRGCMRHHNTLQVCLRRTFDVETALKYKANNLVGHNEWLRNVSQDIAYSLVLRILRNLGFIHIRNQDDIDMILTPLSKEEQDEHLAWILANTHYGFRTGVELILLCEAGMAMISFDRTNSDLKIDEIGQTIVADSWFFNRLSNSWSEADTDQLISLIISGDYAAGDAAFQRRNSAGTPALLSDEWEKAIEEKYEQMSVENRTKMYYVKDRGLPIGNLLPDIRIWTLSEFQTVCRQNANIKGNLVSEVTGITLTRTTFAIDRVINQSIAGISGEYCNSHTLIMHKRLNDAKESGGRIVFATVETLELAKQNLGIIEPDHRIATTQILRNSLDSIRTFRNSAEFQNNMNRLSATKNSI